MKRDRACHSNNEHGYFTIPAAVEYVKGVSPRMLRAWIKKGLPCLRVNRKVLLIQREDLDRFLRGHIEKDDAVDRLIEETVREVKQ